MERYDKLLEDQSQDESESEDQDPEQDHKLCDALVMLRLEDGETFWTRLSTEDSLGRYKRDLRPIFYAPRENREETFSKVCVSPLGESPGEITWRLKSGITLVARGEGPQSLDWQLAEIADSAREQALITLEIIGCNSELVERAKSILAEIKNRHQHPEDTW